MPPKRKAQESTIDKDRRFGVRKSRYTYPAPSHKQRVYPRKQAKGWWMASADVEEFYQSLFDDTTDMVPAELDWAEIKEKAIVCLTSFFCRCPLVNERKVR
jgi:hypothetical protein